jgi:hypothetical protein
LVILQLIPTIHDLFLLTESNILCCDVTVKGNECLLEEKLFEKEILGYDLHEPLIIYEESADDQ